MADSAQRASAAAPRLGSAAQWQWNFIAASRKHCNGNKTNSQVIMLTSDRMRYGLENVQEGRSIVCIRAHHSPADMERRTRHTRYVTIMRVASGLG